MLDATSIAPAGCLARLTLLLITFLVYGLIRNMPGNPLTSDLAQTGSAAA